MNLASLAFDPYSAKITDLIISLINENLVEGQLENQDKLYGFWTKPPQADQGDLAFPCFQLSKVLRKKPNEIAQELASLWQSLDQKESFVERCQAVGPYLNFFFKAHDLAQDIHQKLSCGEFFKRDYFKTLPKTMVEYSQPNTHKELHVGHMRNLCLGNALVNLYRFGQIPTLAATYPGDVGTHVAKCLWYLKNHLKPEDFPTTEKGQWLGKTYSQANRILEEQRGTDQEDKNRQELALILKQIHAQKGEYYKLWQTTRQWSIELMQELYQWAKVDFDLWFFESEVDAPSVQLVHEYFEKGVFVKDQGAIGMDLSEDKLGFCLLLKTDGNGLYATKDVALAMKKFDEHQIKNNIYIVDERQSHHFKQVFKVLEKMGIPEAKDCTHLSYAFVELPEGAMSSRLGNDIPIKKLIDEMKNHIKEQYLSRYINEWTSEEIEETADTIADGAIKYGMTKIDPQKKIIFDMNEWLKLDGNSGPYLQYTGARIQSILNKTDELEQARTFGVQRPLEIVESRMVVKVNEFHQAVHQSIVKNNPSLLCHYCYELCQLFNRFYAECGILKLDDQEIKYQRLNLVQMVQATLKQACHLLGFQIPKRM